MVAESKNMMNSIKRGFLGLEYTEEYKYIRGKYKKLFNLSKYVNKFSHKILSNLQVHNEETREIVLSGLFIKSLSTYQSIIILASKGMTKESNILLRSLIELTYIIIEITKKEDFLYTYLLKGEFEKIRLWKTIKKSESWHGRLGGIDSIVDNINISEKNFRKRLKQYNQEKEDVVNLGPSKIKNKAKQEKTSEAILYEDYYVVYSWLCRDIHSSADSIQDYLSISDFNEIKAVIYGPSEIDIDRILNTNIHCMYNILNSVNNLFDLKEEKTIEKIRKRHESISKMKNKSKN